MSQVAKFILISCCFFSLTFGVVSAAYSQIDDSLNAFLENKKKEADPFAGKTPKVDVESLGLDDVADKPKISGNALPADVLQKSAIISPLSPSQVVSPQLATPQANSVQKSSSKSISQTPAISTPMPIAVTPIVPAKKSGVIPVFAPTVKPTAAATQSPVMIQPQATQNSSQKALDESANKASQKVVHFAKKKSHKAVKEVAEKKGKTETYLSLKKKAKLKQRIESEQRKNEQEKMKKKLQEVRQQYMQTDTKISPSGEVFAEGYEKILPHEKNLNRFAVEENPPPPLMSYVRAQDNRHIPLFLTGDDYIAMLFDAIVTNSDVSFFNEAYRSVRQPNIKNKVGDTLLTCAVLMQRYAIMASILSKGANPNMPNELGYTPLDIAIEMQDVRAMDLLIKNKADISMTDAFGSTYLIHATRIGFLPSVQLLVENGVDVNAMDNEGFTALSIAYRYQREVIVRYLLDKGAKTWVEQPFNTKESNMIQELENRWEGQ